MLDYLQKLRSSLDPGILQIASMHVMLPLHERNYLRKNLESHKFFEEIVQFRNCMCRRQRDGRLDLGLPGSNCFVKGKR